MLCYGTDMNIIIEYIMLTYLLKISLTLFKALVRRHIRHIMQDIQDISENQRSPDVSAVIERDQFHEIG